MTIIAPLITPIIPAVLPPVSNITPFTYRDGWTFLDVLENMRRWLNDVVRPELDDNFQHVIDNLNAALSAQIEYVNGEISDLTEYVDLEIATLTQQLNDAINDVINGTIAITDPIIYGVISNLTSQSGVYLEGRYQKRSETAQHIKRFGVIGDGVADDTAAFNAAVTFAVANNVPLYSDASVNMLVDPISINAFLALQGVFTFTAKTQDQAHVIRLYAKVDFSQASVTVNANNKALYGIRAQAFGRSQFGTVRVDRARIWGLQYEPVGNNNMVTFDYLEGSLNGRKHTTTVTQTAHTANAVTSLGGYSTFSLGTPIPAELITTLSAYFMVYNGLAYKIKSLTTTTMEVFVIDLGDGTNTSFDILIGGAVNITKYGDNGVGRFGGMDLNSNLGVALHVASLYGHFIGNSVMQANSIGYCTSDYTMEMNFAHAYFELNLVDFVSWSYTRGVVTSPLISDLTKIQNITGRLAGEPHRDNFLTWIHDRVKPISLEFKPSANPSAKTLQAGEQYAYQYSANLTTYTLNNLTTDDRTGAYETVIDIIRTSTTAPFVLTIALTDNAETIMGAAGPYVTQFSGSARVILVHIGTDWRVIILKEKVATAITLAPSFIGELAVAGGNGYMATGIATAADWKQITN